MLACAIRKKVVKGKKTKVCGGGGDAKGWNSLWGESRLVFGAVGESEPIQVEVS